MNAQKPTDAVVVRELIAGAICSNRAVDNWQALPCDYELSDFIMATLSAAGYVIVPKEPTEAMVNAGTDVRWEMPTTNTKGIREIYTAMISAAEKGE